MENKMEEYIRRSWVEVNLEQIKKNYQIYKKNVSSECEIMAVVKANAYGHGDVEVATTLMDIGVRNFAVSNIIEACRLRENGIKGQILILGYTPIECMQQIHDEEITQAIISEDYANEIVKTGIRIKGQFAIDTGMNRIGLDAELLSQCEKTIRRYKEKLEITGIFTHLCVADSDKEDIEFTKRQISRFEILAEKIKDLNLPYIHCLNSAGGIWHRCGVSVLTRLGIILYGLKPDYSNKLLFGIKPALSWKSVVAMTQTVRPGETIGYGRTYKVMKPMKIAIIPTGYADGYNRGLSNNGFVLINGKKASIVGRICMDQFMVDVTNIDNVLTGTEVVLLGKSGDIAVTADDMAKLLETIGYEVVCDISSRVLRIYV